MQLVINLRMKAPDSQILDINQFRKTEEGLINSRTQAYYFRLWIENNGNESAEKVQVYLQKLLLKGADDKFHEVKSFIPMNLIWSHSQSQNPVIYADRISPKMGKHCGLGHITKPGGDEPALIGRCKEINEKETLFVLEQEVIPSTYSNALQKGTYRLLLKVAASNKKPVETIFEVNLTGLWFSDDEKMLEEGIGITKVK